MNEKFQSLQHFCERLQQLSQHPVKLDPLLLQQALQHRSTGRGQNYERLEFLGDRVLALHIAQMLIQMYPDCDEGGLAKRHATLVSGRTLSELSQQLQLKSMITVVGGEPSAAICADVMEAILGYLHLTNQHTVLSGLIHHLWYPIAKKMYSAPINARGLLQEWAMQHKLPAPEYHEIERSGSDHNPVFCFSVTVQNLGTEKGWGTSKQIAKTAAAEKLIKSIAS